MINLPKFSRRQVLLMVALYVFAAVALARIRSPYDVNAEISFYAVLICLTVLFLFATGTLSEIER